MTIRWPNDPLSHIVHTSVQDGISSAAHADDATIKRAIAYEKKHGKRSALITGLERELRRRQKPGGKS